MSNHEREKSALAPMYDRSAADVTRMVFLGRPACLYSGQVFPEEWMYRRTLSKLAHRPVSSNSQLVSRISGRVLPAMAVGLTLVACGGAAAPTQRLTTAESSVRAAEVGGAEEIPKGELHLKYARDAIASAKKLMEQGDNEAAALYLDRAAVDAEKALALADEDKARVEAETELKKIQEMMDQ